MSVKISWNAEEDFEERWQRFSRMLKRSDALQCN